MKVSLVLLWSSAEIFYLLNIVAQAGLNEQINLRVNCCCEPLRLITVCYGFAISRRTVSLCGFISGWRFGNE